MKKLILKGIIFIGLLLAIIKIVVDPYFFKKEEGFFKESALEFYDSNKDSIDILIFGSSHAQNSYNPSKIDGSLNTFTINLGSASQKLQTTKYLIEEAINKSSPKLVVLDLFSHTVPSKISERDKEFQLIVYNNTKNSILKFYDVNDYYGIQEYILSESPTLRSHNKWFKGDTNIENSLTIRGFVPFNKKIQKKYREKYKDFFKKTYSNNTNKSSLEYLSKKQRNLIVETIQLLKDNNIEVLLVTSPFIEYFYFDYHEKFNSSIRFLADSLKINYLDFNKEFNSLNLDFKNFHDGSHLNVSGSNKISSYLAKYISENYNFEIKDSSYIFKYVDRIKPRTKEDIKNRSNKKPENIIQTIVNNGVKLNVVHNFFENLKIENAFFYSDDFERHIAFRVGIDFPKNALYNMRFGIHGTFYEKDFSQRPLRFLGTEAKRIPWVGEPNIVDLNDESYILMSYEKECDIEQWKQLRIFLIDKDEYKGAIGVVLEIDDIMFSLPEGVTLEEQRESIRKRESPLNAIIKDGLKVIQTHKFSEELTLNEFIFYSNKNNRFIVIPYSEGTSINYLNDKAFGIHGVAYDKDLDKLPSWVVEKGGNKTTWRGVPEKVELEGKYYLMMKLSKNCDIEQW